MCAGVLVNTAVLDHTPGEQPQRDVESAMLELIRAALPDGVIPASNKDC